MSLYMELPKTFRNNSLAIARSHPFLLLCPREAPVIPHDSHAYNSISIILSLLVFPELLLNRSPFALGLAAVTN